MKFFMCLVLLLLSTSQGYCLLVQGQKLSPPDTSQKKDNATPTIQIKYGNKGWEFSTTDGHNKLQVQSRLQFRFAHPTDTDPISFDDFDDQRQNIFKVNRARLKIGGNVYQQWLKFYWEYELASTNLLDFQMMIEKYPALSFRVGQWKARYSRERIISSGKQQLVDRSLINRPFTLDRQQGISLYGHLKGRNLVNINYWFEILTGTGRGSKFNDDRHFMYVFRTQWNVLNGGVRFEGSDLDYHDKPVSSVTLAVTTNRSPYTRFSQTGGGQLEGFEEGQPGQYRVNQWMAETAFMVKGFSWQQEFHWKQIDDNVNRSITTLLGNYLQFGYFFHYWLTWFPKPLEIAFRQSWYRPDSNLSQNDQFEYSLDINWFFKDHLNKLTAEISLFDFKVTPQNQRDGWRFRIQWDISM
ncbi:MAG: porin [bacterium]|nr:MAG: porin [bacterium]